MVLGSAWPHEGFAPEVFIERQSEAIAASEMVAGGGPVSVMVGSTVRAPTPYSDVASPQ